MEALGFKLRHENENTLRYHTDAMKEADANELTTFMEKVKDASSEVFMTLHLTTRLLVKLLMLIL